MVRTPEKALWQAVVYQAVYDATSTFDSSNPQERRERRAAKVWIETGGRDFQTVCALAGFDPQFIRDAYLGGRIDFDLLRSAPVKIFEKAEQ